MKRYEDPAWMAGQALRLDYNYAMADFVGEAGLSSEELEALTPRLEAIHENLTAERQAGRLAFYDLPYQREVVKEIHQVAKPLLEWCWEFVVLGIGGSALGARALHQALCHPQHNRLTPARRHHKLGLWVLDNIDPDYFYGLLDGLDLRRTAVNVISKSGNTPETLAQFLFLYGLFKGRFGEEKARERFIITTDPEKGSLRRLAEREGFLSLSVPPQVGGRFSVLTPVGLLPAAVVGIDLEELLAGARFMDHRLKESQVRDNLAYRLAALYYLFSMTKGRPILVIMPYASSLAGLAEWFCQLWGESLGKRLDISGQVAEVGSTPVRAVGVTDQHSQLQLYIEGPQDKVITFLQVEKFQHQIDLPPLFADLDSLNYLGGHSLNELFRVEETATAFNLKQARRPNLTLVLPEINAFTLGQLIFLWEVVTVAAAGLLKVNPLDQPGVEGGKLTTYGLMGRPGFENYRSEFADAAPKVKDYII
ncbi:MAG: glucose-6-phosphate isomerase [Thermodesulfobacteriota bacterium]